MQEEGSESGENGELGSGGARANLRFELSKLEEMLGELKVLYEQYFLGVSPLPPDKLHTKVKMAFRAMRRAAFKSSEISYRLRALQTRYQTLNTYWQRVLREREAGTYSRDVFKANIRERAALEESFAQTAGGMAEKGLKSLFEAYRHGARVRKESAGAH